MKHIKKVIFIISFFILTGCVTSENTHNVIFSDEIKIEYQDTVDTSQFVKRVDSFLINDSMRQNNRINVSNFTVICPEIKSKKLGKISLIYKIGNEKYITHAEIVDTTKPMIYVDTKDFIFEYGTFSLEKLKSKIHIKDNYDSRDVLVCKFKGIDKVDSKNPGEYPITIYTKDSSNNESEKNIVIKILEKKSIDNESKKSDKNETVSPEKPQNDTDVGGVIPEYNPSTPPPNKPSYQTKDYLFSDGYDMNTAPAACQADLLNSGRSGSCIPIQDENGIYLGMRLTFR